MSNSTNLNLPYLLANQAQKHVTHNEALKILDVLVQLSVVDNTLSAPPQSPSEGDSYTIATSPTGVWAGKENQVTIWHDGAWSFYAPDIGWVSWVANQNALMAYDGTDWVVVSGSAGELSTSDLSDGTITTLGVNATADTTNRLSINSGAILFNKEVDDVQVKLNKQASTDNASFLFQTNFSGRAEIGTTGNDDFHFKVSSDGTTWKEGILIDAGTGEVSFPNTTLNVPSTTDPVDNLVTRVFNRISPTQWGFCHVVSEAYTDLAKTTKAIAVDDVIAVIEDKSPNDIDLVAGGTDAANKIKLRLDPLTVGVDESHLTTHFLKVTAPTGGFKGTLIMAYRSGCIVNDVDAPSGEWEIWSGHSLKFNSSFMGAFAAENISNAEIEEVKNTFFNLGAGSKPLDTATDVLKDINPVYKTFDFSQFDFSGTSSLYRFARNSSAKRIIVDGSDFGNATNMHSAFENCTNLTDLDVSNWNTASVETFRNLFFLSNKIQDLDVRNWDTSSATSMRSMFNGCQSLNNLDVRNWDTSSVTSMRGTFQNANSFTFIDISNFDTSNLADASSMFLSCDNLTSIKIGSAFDNTPCINFLGAFIGCALDQQTVDDILVSIENAGTSGGTLQLYGGTNSAPSSVGSAAKTALQGRGWTVTTQ